MARLEVPCMVLDEYDLQQRTTLCEWRQDRHDLEAARVFGGAHMDMTKFPIAFHRRGAQASPSPPACNTRSPLERFLLRVSGGRSRGAQQGDAAGGRKPPPRPLFVES